MENLRKGLSDMLSLIIPKENDICYSWSEIALGMLILSIFLAACFLASIVS
ncbi:hypothetical protein [Pedobacter sp. D749]|uniref:hypothetical protein n=1 Tax=Pedobacter sp. D749 TaxID=2856523 RepID=UPI001C58A446|nr:hypothetical protein [Pedobacter sp. D749]QXU41455.1 hypothetical protein KYH19_21025 [Pedobacter sp. D749]